MMDRDFGRGLVIGVAPFLAIALYLAGVQVIAGKLPENIISGGDIGFLVFSGFVFGLICFMTSHGVVRSKGGNGGQTALGFGVGATVVLLVIVTLLLSIGSIEGALELWAFVFPITGGITAGVTVAQARNSGSASKKETKTTQ